MSRQRGSSAIPIFQGRKVLGLDIGHSTIKAVELERANGDWKITRAASIQTPVMAIREGVVFDVTAVSNSIRLMLKEGQFQATSANIAVSGNSVLVRPIVMPKMNMAMLRKSIKFEVARYVSGQPTDNFVECEIVSDLPPSQMNVLLVAAPKDMVCSRLDACRQAGLEVDVVEVEAFSSVRALVESNREIDLTATYAVIDMGAVGTSVSVLRQGKFEMNRSISFGGNSFTSALQQAFRLSEEDAEAGKSQLDVSALVDPEATITPPIKVIGPLLDDLVREIRRSLQYFQSQAAEGEAPRQVDQILLSGGGSWLHGLEAYLTSKLSQPVMRLTIQSNPRFQHSTADSFGYQDYSVAIGLAMRSVSGVKAA